MALNTKAKNTFQINPDEEPFAKALREGGSNQEQITQALARRRNIKQNLGTSGEQNIGESQSSDFSNPFGGKSKKAVLLDAFNKGVKDTTELEKIETLYDKLVGAEGMDVPEDMSILSYEQQQQARGQIKEVVASKAQSLATGAEREGVMGSLGTLETGQEIINMMEVNDVSTGLVSGRVRQGVSVFGVPVIPGARALGKTSEDEDRFDSLTTIYTAQFIKAISGAQVSDKEREFLMTALPSETKTRQANIEGIKAISEYLTNRYSPTVGVDMSPLTPQAGNSDPLGLNSSKRSKENPLGI